MNLTKFILKLVLLVWLLLYGNICQAQFTFNNTYNDNIDVIFNTLQQDNEYWMVMTSLKIPDQPFIINKLDSVGNVILSRTYGDSTEYYVLYTLIETSDSNYVTGCFLLDLINGKRQVYIAKFDSNMDTIWTSTIDAPVGFNYNGQYLIETSDFGFLITGQIVDNPMTYGDIFILKTDSVGNYLWHSTFGGAGYDAGFSSVETPDKGFLTWGWTRSFGFGSSSNRDDFLVKWDSIGNYQWHKTYGTSLDEYAVCINKLNDGNFIIGSAQYNSVTDILNGKLKKIDSAGNIIWQNLYSTKSTFWWVSELINYDIVVVGSSRQANNKDDGLIIITDSSGTQKWRRQYRVGNDHCYFRDVDATSDGGFVCAGFVFDGPSGNQDGWILKLDSLGCLVGNCGLPTGLFETNPSSTYQIQVFPNPIIDRAIIKVEGLNHEILQESFLIQVYDLTGKLVQSPRTGFLISETGFEFEFNKRELKPGLYIIAISTYNGENIGRIKVLVN
jgi:Secretion system C-terminal sorting domain